MSAFRILGLFIGLGSAFGTFAQEASTPAACPILIQQIHPHWIFGEGDPWGSYLLVVFKNTSSKTIAAVRFGVSFVDALADTHQSVYSYDSDSTVKPGKSSKPEWSDGVYAGSLGHKVGAIVWVEKARFADNTFFMDDGSHSCGAQNTVAGQLTAPPHPSQTATPAPSNPLPEEVLKNSEAGKGSPAAAASLASVGHVLSPQELADLVQKGQASKCAVVTVPPGAEVDIDGNKAGVSPFAFVLLKQGDTPRTITIKMNGYKTIEKTFVPDGKTIPIGLTLEKQ